ncbi:uncharacterized protein C8orf58 homolog [Rhynochetos jubatus]
MWGGSRAVWKRRFSCYGPWETAESCVVGTSASVYRRLQESPRHPPGGSSTGGPPPEPPISPSSASGRLPESEDSGVEMASNENSPRTPSGSQSIFSLDGFPPEKTPPGEKPTPEPPRPPRSRSASRKPVPVAQRRQRVPGRCGRSVSEERDPREPEDAIRGGRPPGSPGSHQAVPGQGLRYLEHVCQMLERLARLQQDNRLLRQRDARRARPDATDPALWRGERFRPRSCSDSQAPGERAPGPCQRTWGHSASFPSLLDPPEGGAGAPTPDKDGRSQWGRVKVLLTRLTRRSLRGGRCR